VAKKKFRIGSRSVPAEPQQVTPLRRVLTDQTELLLLERGRIVFPERGGIPLLKVLDQAYDQPNVVALDLLLGEKELTDIRKLDKELERRLYALLNRGERGTLRGKTWSVRLRLIAVVG
jgi:hypothetical protein